MRIFVFLILAFYLPLGRACIVKIAPELSVQTRMLLEDQIVNYGHMMWNSKLKEDVSIVRKIELKSKAEYYHVVDNQGKSLAQKRAPLNNVEIKYLARKIECPKKK